MNRPAFFRLALILILAFSLWASCSKNRNDITGNIDDTDSVDTTPPRAITDLRAAHIGTNDAEICWTAPGDDNGSGVAIEYDLRGSLDSITAANFDSALVISGVNFPIAAGGTQCHSVFDLVGDVTYFVAMKTRDEVNNWSTISNCVRFTCLTDSIVVFPDTALDRAIRQAINRPTDPIRKSHLIHLINLLAGDKGIADLTGLEHCAALQNLTLPENSIVNIDPIGALKSLKALNLIGNQITDLSAVSSLTNLEQLYISNNPLTDLTPISGLTKLTHLSINVIPATDFSPLSGLTAMRELQAGGNDFRNLSALTPLIAMKSLLLYACHITDISALQNLVTLEELWLPINQIVDITPIAALTNLKTLVISDNRIVDIQPLVNNSGLQTGDVVNLTSNPLSTESISQHIPALQARGVNVSW